VEAVLVAAIATAAMLVVIAAARIDGVLLLRGEVARPVPSLGTNRQATTARGVVGIAESLWRLDIHETATNRGPWVDDFTERHAEAWCADFVSWVLRAAGTPLAGGLGGWRVAAAVDVQRWFAERGRFTARQRATPWPGDIVSFHHGHVGIVVAVVGATLITVEGNAGDAVSRRTYPDWRTWRDIAGFGRTA
jgi:hypothetical protein